ncbi:unnamed protein product, partial [Trichogramma brassicae]
MTSKLTLSRTTMLGKRGHTIDKDKNCRRSCDDPCRKYARTLSCFSQATSSKIISELGRASSGESTASCSLN